MKVKVTNFSRGTMGYGTLVLPPGVCEIPLHEWEAAWSNTRLRSEARLMGPPGTNNSKIHYELPEDLPHTPAPSLPEPEPEPAHESPAAPESMEHEEPSMPQKALEDMTSSELREVAAAHDVDVRGMRKSDMLEAIQAHLAV